MFVKYQRVKRNKKFNIYSLFMLHLQRCVDSTRIRCAQMDAMHCEKRARQALAAFANNVPYRRMQRAKAKAAEEQWENWRIINCYKALKSHYETRKRIKSDKILWQAHSTNAEFFNVGVTLSSAMLRPDHAESNEDMTLTRKEKIKINLI